MRISALLVPSLFLLAVASSRACDLCGCFTPQLNAAPHAETAHQGFYAAISEQFTHYGTLQFEGEEVANPTDQYLNSSITQLVVGYDINERFAIQLNLPIIYREFKRPEGFAIDSGSESGIGDLALILKTVLFHFSSGARKEFQFQGKNEGKNPVAIEHEPDFTASVVLLTGVKFPTGDTDRLNEEFVEMEVPGAPESGIHGHDLTLGTGSYDGIFGLESTVRYRNFFLEADFQYALRGEGDHTFEPADDLIWKSGPGYYLIRREDVIVGAQFVVSGEHKDLDRFNGEAMEDSGITSVFVGPRIVASHGRWSAEVAVDLPVDIDNTALQAVPNYRVRAGFSYQF